MAQTTSDGINMDRVNILISECGMNHHQVSESGESDFECSRSGQTIIKTAWIVASIVANSAEITRTAELRQTLQTSVNPCKVKELTLG